MADVTERFLRYVAVDTQSEDEQEAFPSTEKQKNLGRMLKEELEALGVSDVRMDDYGYVYGCLPANTEKKVPQWDLSPIWIQHRQHQVLIFTRRL